MIKGSITRRGKKSWRLKFDVGRDPVTNKRRTQYHTVKGTKEEAGRKLVELLDAVGKGTYVEPSKLTLAEWVRTRIDHWQNVGTHKGKISPKTRERYDQLLDGQIAPHLGAIRLQKLTTTDIEGWHAQLGTGGRKDGDGGVSGRTICHAHRLLGHALKDALRHNLVSRNVASLQAPPSVDRGDKAGDGEEMKILNADEQRTVLAGLAGKPLYSLVVTALYTGLRRGELLAVCWRNADLDAKVLRVRESLEQTKKGLRFKTAKTRAGRRDVTLPTIVVDALREHRRVQLEERVALGLGKLPDDALVFPNVRPGRYGEPQAPNTLSKEWGVAADGFGVPDVTLHGLRHTHASQLIDAGVDIVTISRRLGHASPNITLQVYAHLFRTSDDKAAAAINAALAAPRQS